MKTKQTAFRLPEDVKAAAELKAKSQRRSLANYVIRLMEADLGTMVQEAASQLEDSGKSDLASGKADLKKAAKAVKYTGRQPRKNPAK